MPKPKLWFPPPGGWISRYPMVYNRLFHAVKVLTGACCRLRCLFSHDPSKCLTGSAALDKRGNVTVRDDLSDQPLLIQPDDSDVPAISSRATTSCCCFNSPATIKLPMTTICHSEIENGPKKTTQFKAGLSSPPTSSQKGLLKTPCPKAATCYLAIEYIRNQRNCHCLYKRTNYQNTQNSIQEHPSRSPRPSRFLP